MIYLDVLEWEAKDCLAQGIHSWGQKIDITLKLIARIRELEVICKSEAENLYTFVFFSEHPYSDEAVGLGNISKRLLAAIAKGIPCDHTDSYGSLNLDGHCMNCGIRIT